MRPSIFVYPHRLAAIRRTVAASLSVRSSHAAEAVAAGFGFRTYAAALSHLRGALPGLVWGDDRHVLDADLFADRIVQLTGPIEHDLARTVFLHACGQEGPSYGGVRPEDHPDAATTHASRMTMVARARLARLPFLLGTGRRAETMVAVDLRVRKGVEGFVMENGVLYFDPRRLPVGVSRDAVVEMIVPLCIGLETDEVASGREVDRLLARSGVRTSSTDVLASIEALRTTDRHLTDAVATRILTGLTASSDRLDVAMRRETALAMLRLSTERLSTLGRSAVDAIVERSMEGNALLHDDRPLHSEQSIYTMGRVNSKRFLRFDDDPLATFVDVDGRRGLGDLAGEQPHGPWPSALESPFLAIRDEHAYRIVDGVGSLSEEIPARRSPTTVVSIETDLDRTAAGRP